MHLSSDDVAQIIHEVWSSMLGIEVEPVDAPRPESDDAIAGSDLVVLALALTLGAAAGLLKASIKAWKLRSMVSGSLPVRSPAS